MITLRRLARYIRPLWRLVLLGVVFMAFFAMFSGFSIGLILPIVDKVFVRNSIEVPEATSLSMGEALGQTAGAMEEAWHSTPGLNERLTAVREAGGATLMSTLDRVPPMKILAWICVFTMVTIFLKNAADYGRKLAFIRVEQRAAEAIRNDLFRHVVAFPLATFQKVPSGQLLSRLVTDVELVKQFTINVAASFVHNFIQVLVFLVVIFWASTRLSMVSLLIVPPIAFLTGRLASKLKRQSGRAQARIADVTSVVSETLTNIRVVKGFANETGEAARFQNHTGRYRRSVERLMSLDTLAAPLSEFWGVGIGVSVLYYGGTLVLGPDSSMTPGRFFVFFLALVSMLHPLKELANVVTRFQRGVAAADRVFEIMAMPIEVDAPDAVAVHELRESIRFEGVSFAYETERTVLHDVSFETRAGTTTALVGPSGGGKSTLVDLIPRFHDPQSGQILLDGRDLRSLRRADLRGLIGVVTQETILFNDTVASNIAYGVPGATRDQVVDAARSANAHEFIEDLPLGYDTIIGERGMRLSGGQRQRLAIARALLRDPVILILDEATSSLDTESEVAVQEAIERLVVNRTTFVIAHRLSTVMRADQIVVVDQGRVVEAGTHRELLAEGTLYRRLHDLQFRDQEVPQA